jgi:hypothetical protein
MEHESGETRPPIIRTVAVPFNGAQAFGSAQSYALKLYYRAVFQISTFDGDDPDFQATHDEPAIVEPKRAVAEPTIEPVINDETIAALLKLADELAAFPSRDVFAGWITATCKTGLENITQARGDKIIAFLAKTPDASKWPAQHVAALAESMKLNGEENNG